LLPGQLVANKWRLVQRIGRGAFGDIFIGAGEEEQHAGKVRLTTDITSHENGDRLALETSDVELTLSSVSSSLQRYAMKLEKLPAPPLAADGALEPSEAERQKAQAAAAARAVLKLEAVILSKLQKYPFVSVN
jgi:hypothetical protein